MDPLRQPFRDQRSFLRLLGFSENVGENVGSSFQLLDEFES
jgi:hypothetical protein